MSNKVLRGAVVGASSLLGKELAEELKSVSGVSWNVSLFDGEEAGGQMTAAGDEPLVIQPLSQDGFAGMDVVFFAGTGEIAAQYWDAAKASGAAIVDLTGGLEVEAGVKVESAWRADRSDLDVVSSTVVSAHPVAAILVLLAERLRHLGLKSMAATVLLPASESGQAGVAELQQQTVGLLTFKPLVKEVYEGQVAFNLATSFGEEAKASPEKMRERIVRHIQRLQSGKSQAAGPEVPVAVQVVQAPVFHGYAVSVYVHFGSPVEEDKVLAAVDGSPVSRLGAEEDVSNEQAVSAREMKLHVRRADESSDLGSGYWIWMAGDNLRLAAQNAEGCAARLIAARQSVSG